MKRILTLLAASALLAGPALADHTGTTHKHGPALTPPAQTTPVSRTPAPQCRDTDCQTKEAQ